MEQTIIEFFSKSSELILYNRLTNARTIESALNLVVKSNQLQFQLNFEQKFNFSAKIPSQWNSQKLKLLVLEFFLSNKTTNEKFVVEQWIFELNQVSDEKLKNTIDSQSTFYKKLSILLRSISLLTTTLPLYRSFLGDKNNRLWEYYNLEHSINFTRHTIANWHYTVHEDKMLGSYTNPDLVLPGRTFAFKVNYVKSLKFLQTMVEEEVFPQTKTLKLFKEKLDFDYFASKSKNRKADKNTIDNKNEQDNQDNKAGSEGESEEEVSPFGSILTNSPIETQKSPRSEERSRNSLSEGYPYNGNRPRFRTIDSEGSGEYNVYMCQNGDAQLADIVAIRDIDTRDETPRKFNLDTRLSGDEKMLIVEANRFEMDELKIAEHAKQIEKIAEQTDDDKLAEIIQVVEEVKECYFAGVGKEGTGNKMTEENEEGVKGGFRFYEQKKEVDLDDRKGPTMSVDYDGLGKLYSKLMK